MRIGILGGSFNPPHNWHLNIALGLTEKKVIDKVIFIPNISNPYHDKNLIKPEDRYNMVKIMIKGHSNLEISDIDIRKDKQSYSYQTLDELSLMYPHDELYLIIGSDNLKEIEHWGKAEYLLSNYKIIVTKRGTDDISLIIKNNPFLLEHQNNIIPFNNFKSSALSSTIIRKKLSKSQNIENVISKEVLKYIKDNNLYLEGSDMNV